MFMHRIRSAFGFAVLAALAAPATALAHHPMGGTTPETLMQGLLSGFGHPLIGLDHFAFILALGVLAATLARPLVPVAAFLLSAMAGTALHLMAFNIPYSEALVALSVLALGAAVAAQLRDGPWLAPLLLGIAGVLHGYAYGEAVIGAEPTPIFAYLLGFTVIQGVVVLGTAVLWRRILAGVALAPRIAGGAVAVFGAVLLVL